MNHMEIMAQELVRAYTNDHLGLPKNYGVYTVWKCKILQNWKFLISTTLEDGMYYEVTVNGDKNEVYLDAYKKVENKCLDYDLSGLKTVEIPNFKGEK